MAKKQVKIGLYNNKKLTILEPIQVLNYTIQMPWSKVSYGFHKGNNSAIELCGSFELVKGYSLSKETNLAIEKGEVNIYYIIDGNEGNVYKVIHGIQIGEAEEDKNRKLYPFSSLTYGAIEMSKEEIEKLFTNNQGK
jgi:hypothetical protein